TAPVAEMTDRLVTDLARALAAALAGDGHALAPIGPGPERDQIRSMLQVDIPLERDDVAVVLPTSGSTGEPKGALLPASALLHSARATLSRLGGPGRWVMALPPSRVAGLQVLVRSVVAGTTPVPVVGAFTAEAFQAATTRALSSGPARLHTALVPTQLARLLDAGPVGTAALRTYDAVLLGGGASAPDLLQRATSAGVRVVTTYGMTETCGGCVYDGHPLDGVEVELLPVDGGGTDVGRIGIRGPVVFAGYRLRPELTAGALVDGCHVTEDLGRWGSDGRLEVVGRRDDVVVSGGVNVPLLAVEQAVASYPGIAEAGAVGVPDPEWGTRVVAYAVLRPGVSPPALDAVRAHVGSRHPRAWAPRQLVVVDALPLLASGKLDRIALRAQAQGAAGAHEPGNLAGRIGGDGGGDGHGRPARTQAS
ncbi:MAG TPA: AMP-binding protein, partial [Actinopolymorphaceae bacterium]|nr:AMP-binding protein [Actinopolymorphaceae bacterium]